MTSCRSNTRYTLKMTTPPAHSRSVSILACTKMLMMDATKRAVKRLKRAPLWGVRSNCMGSRGPTCARACTVCQLASALLGYTCRTPVNWCLLSPETQILYVHTHAGILMVHYKTCYAMLCPLCWKKRDPSTLTLVCMVKSVRPNTTPAVMPAANNTTCTTGTCKYASAKRT